MQAIKFQPQRWICELRWRSARRRTQTVSSCFSPTFICRWTCSGARYLPHLIKRFWDRKDRPGQSIRPELASRSSAEGYRAMDERRAIKTLLSP